MPNPWDTLSFETADSPPETPEEHLEKQEIIEAAQLKRANLLKDIFSSRAADLAGNWIPGIDVPKMAIEAALGKTTSGKELSTRERFDYFVMAGGITLAYALELAGMVTEALTARSAVAVLSKLEFGPEILGEIAEKAEAKFPKAAHLLEKTGEFIGVKRDAVMKQIGQKVLESFQTLQPEMLL